MKYCSSKLNLFCIFSYLFGSSVCGQTLEKNTNVIHAISLIGNALEGCYLSASTVPFFKFLASLQHCLQNKSLLVLDKMEESEVLQLSDGIQFVDNKIRVANTISNNTR